MFRFENLDIPIVAAPMAGGPSTPDLVLAATAAGGFGFLAGGDRPIGSLKEQVDAVRTSSSAPFGVNLMVPGDPALLTEARAGEVAAYRQRLQPWADRFGVEIPDPAPSFRDDWDEKLSLLVNDPVACVSFIFGCSNEATISRLHEAGSSVAVTVTNVDDAMEAARRGVDVLIVQGPDAGGHQGTWSVAAGINTLPLPDLLAAVRDAVDVSLIAAGGVGAGRDIAQALARGASAVQIGTALVRTPECGASTLHKNMLASGRFTETMQTRAFSGRVARGLRNAFMDDLSGDAPMAYPEVNQMTKRIRGTAAGVGEPDGCSIWAGLSFALAADAPAVEVITTLWRDAKAEGAIRNG